MLLDLGRKIEFLSNIKEGFLVINTFAMIAHTFYSNNTFLSEDPFQ